MPYAVVVIYSRNPENLRDIIGSDEFRRVLVAFKTQLTYAGQSDEPISITTKQGAHHTTYCVQEGRGTHPRMRNAPRAFLPIRNRFSRGC